jgi:hypothetical protein
MSDSPMTAFYKARLRSDLTNFSQSAVFIRDVPQSGAAQLEIVAMLEKRLADIRRAIIFIDNVNKTRGGVNGPQ